MLLGMEKKKSTGDEVDSKFSLRSELDHAEIDDERRKLFPLPQSLPTA